jgi:S1-C subfamily serine protease
MNTKTLIALTAFIAGLAGLSLGLIANERKPVNAKPELKIDSTPVAAVKSDVVTSYADVLDPVRPAVVSVYSSKLVRARVPEFYRQFGLQGR